MLLEASADAVPLSNPTTRRGKSNAWHHRRHGAMVAAWLQARWQLRAEGRSREGGSGFGLEACTRESHAGNTAKWPCPSAVAAPCTSSTAAAATELPTLAGRFGQGAAHPYAPLRLSTLRKGVGCCACSLTIEGSAVSWDP
eukprot:s634_g10.t1